MADIQPGELTAVLDEMKDTRIDMSNHTDDLAIKDELNNLASHISSVATRVLGYESAQQP